MKSRVFILGFVSCLLVGGLAWLGFTFVKYPQSSRLEKVSSSFPGYVVDGDAEAQLLAKETYWLEKESSLKVAAEQWCKERGIDAGVDVRCTGSVVECYFSVEYEGWMSARQKKQLDEYMELQMALVYHEVSITRDRIFSRWMRVNL